MDPGVCSILQEQTLPSVHGPLLTTCAIGEVYIPRNSNTPAVCRKLVADWGKHKGPVFIYGDATGGARKSSQTQGSDWDLVREYLGPHFDLHWRVGRSNPPERERVNAVNARLMSAAGIVRFAIDPTKAPKLVQDLEGVSLLEGGSGELDKKRDPTLTHISDAFGYYIATRYPTGGHRTAFD